MRGPAQACHSSRQTPDEEEDPLTPNAEAEDEESQGERDPEPEDGVVSSSCSSVTFRSIKPPIREIERDKEIKDKSFFLFLHDLETLPSFRKVKRRELHSDMSE